MEMDAKEKFLFVWILLVMIFTFISHRFWDCMLCALEKGLAFSILSMPGIAKVAAVICSVGFLR
jgi:hypothetical protein